MASNSVKIGLLAPDDDPEPSTEAMLLGGLSTVGTIEPRPSKDEYSTSNIHHRTSQGGASDIHMPISSSRSDFHGVELGLESQDKIDEGNEDFVTIDWTYYAEKDREFRKKMERQMRNRPLLVRFLYNIYDSLQSWLALALVGFLCGFIASIIDTGTDWASDIKFGFCNRGFWINRAMCCKSSVSLDGCDSWLRWSDMFGVHEDKGANVVNYVMYVVMAMFMATYCAWIVVTFSSYAAGSGISEIKVILGGFVIKRFLGAWTLCIKTVGVVLSVGSGLPIGKEGPFIHVACCIANICSRFFSKYFANEGKKRELLSGAAAAGMSVGFGAPVGGVLFSLEEVSSYFPPKTMWRSFFCAIVAAITLQRLNPLHSGKLVMFEVTYHHQWKWFEIIPFIVIGAIGGLIGVIFVRLSIKLGKFRKSTRIHKHPILEVFVVTLFISIINYLIVYLRGAQTELLASLFSECKNTSEDVYDDFCDSARAPFILSFLLLSSLISLGGTIICFGLKLPAGVFIPSLTIGALLGRMIGFAMELLQNQVGDVGFFASCVSTTRCITPGIYAIVGAAAVLGGVTRMTVSLVVIMFELTGGLEYILPVMVSVIISKWVGDSFGRESIYDELIAINGYPYLDNKAEYAFTERAADVMSTTDLCVLPMHGNTVASLELRLKETNYQGYPVVTSQQDMLIVGYIARPILIRVLERARMNERVNDSTRCYFTSDHPFPRNAAYVDMSPWLDQSPIQIVEQTPLDRVIEMFRALGLRYVLVTRHGQLVGIIKKKDILEHIEIFHQRTHRTRTDDSGL